MPWHVKPILFVSFYYCYFFCFNYKPKARVCINANILPHIVIHVFSLILSTPMILVNYTIFSMVLGRQVECLQMMGCSQLDQKYESWYLGYQKCLPRLSYLNMPFNFETFPSPFFIYHTIIEWWIFEVHKTWGDLGKMNFIFLDHFNMAWNLSCMGLLKFYIITKVWKWMKMSFFTFKLFITWIRVNWYFFWGGRTYIFILRYPQCCFILYMYL
jgi:hypothetical protein